jgi:2',3'-cyclic-nucleotide 2'-phosphodiesterase (5'-nucleotidase family)
LLLDAGDAVSAGNLGCRMGGEPVLRLMSDLGYDAMTIGNRESHPRRELFPKKLRDARFPVLCANMTAGHGVPLPTRPWLSVERAGFRIAIMGLSVPMFTRSMWSRPFCDYLYEDPIRTASALAGELRPACDLLIALTHLGLRVDQSLAAAVPEIDVVVGGHSHSDLSTPVWVGKTPILHTTAHAEYVGRACLERQPDGWQLTRWERFPLQSVDAGAVRAATGRGTAD